MAMANTRIPCEVHLLVMIHGMWGTPSNLSETKRVISEKHASAILDLDSTSVFHEVSGTQLDILVTQTNQTSSTYDGIDWGGERVAEEIYERIAKIEQDGFWKVTSFSLFGYSLGGLLARYVLGILHSTKFFETVKPVNFSTFATPHIGLPRYRSLLSKFSATVASKLLSRTGEQFYGIDTWGKERRPLLEVMADKDRIFWRALSLFPNIHIYANSVSDPTVPFVTAAIELEDPFLALDTDELDVKLDPVYGALIESYEHVSPPRSSKYSLRSLAPTKPFLPLFLKRGFLFETTVLALSPVLFPAVVSLAVLRLASDSHASRSRIRLLEADETNQFKLVNMLDSLEGAVDTLIEPITNPEQDIHEQTHGTAMLPSPSASDTPTVSEVVGPESKSRTRTSSSGSRPILTEAQKQMVHSLNELTQMQKHFSFFHPVRNAHGLIVCRDVEEARRVGGEWEALTRQGEGVLRHWADGFVL